jgi:hydrogenase expression/formation protein HypE
MNDAAGPSRRKRPRFTDDIVTMAHGAGGSSAEALVDAVFLPLFNDPELLRADDGAVLPLNGFAGDLVMTTDSFVVRPRQFPGGSIGTLAVCGTVNDLAVMGAVPRWLSVAFVLEEGLAIEELRSIVSDMATMATTSGVRIVAGDTKVVERGAADGCFITTTGIGTRAYGSNLGAEQVRVGDRVIVSGQLGDHGMAVLLARGDLALSADIESDCAPLNELIHAVRVAAPNVRWMRDPTRGGLASALNELVRANDLSVTLDELAIPVAPAVAGACELLGIDPLYVANEGKVVFVVPPDETDAALQVMRAHRLGVNAAIIGTVTAEPSRIVMVRTAFGGERIVDLLVGDPLPRIC